MKRLPLVILLAVVALVAVVTGCGRARYDSRLAAADSLMHDAPDSALALVEAVSPASLTADGDRAYRDLLLTQARYRCYITATSDSGINRALDYYHRHSGEREKLTRAYIYKGAVMEELGHPDSAMFYYKHAEATANEKDYANLGQINTRIADLYRMYYGDEETCFDKYRRALYYYQLTGNKQMQQNCLFNMANCSADSAISNYRQYYQLAYNLALEMNDSAAMYNCQEFYCRHLYAKDSTLEEAKSIALNCLNNYSRFCHKDVLIDLAFIYAYQNDLDSARFYLNASDIKNGSSQLIMRYYWALSLILKNEGDTVKSNYYNALKSQIADSIDNNKEKNHIQRIENLNNETQASIKRLKILNLQALTWLLSMIIVFVILSVGLYHHIRMRHFKSIIKELENADITDGLDIDKHEILLQQVGDKDSTISQFVQNMVSFMQTSIDISEKDSPNVIKRKIRDTISNVMTEEFWTELRAYLDRNYNNIISVIAQNPKITNKDLKFIELSCCGFGYIEIAVALGYSPKYISTKRKDITKKLGINTSLQDYLDSHKK